MSPSKAKQLAGHLDRLAEARRGRHHVFMFDYDGTLVPMKPKPHLARMSVARRRMLSALARTKGISVAIITGRSLADIRRLLPLPEIILAANHGCEISFRGAVLYPCGRKHLQPMTAMARALSSATETIPGVLVESKGFSVALHYRLTPRRFWKELLLIVRDVSKPWRKKHGFRITGGKRIWEIRPSLQWNKGKAALWIIQRFVPGAVPWYFGDDETDEDAFRTLRQGGITMCIGGRKRTLAKHRLQSVSDVWTMIRLLVRQPVLS
jgi:trehalose 6-phosphate phosphatase